MSAASMFDHCSFTHQFKLNYEETKNLAVGEPRCVTSGDIYAGGYLWRQVQPDCGGSGGGGRRRGGGPVFLPFFLQLVSEAEEAKAIFEVYVMGRDGALSSSHRASSNVHVHAHIWALCGSPRIVKRSVLMDSRPMTSDGCFIIMCGVKVVRDNNDPLDDVPPSDIGRHLGVLLHSGDGADVSFVIAGEAFLGHRAVLAARSPVFKAQLLSSMADANMPSITLEEIAPATFKAMLRFMYTDVLPGDEEGDDHRFPTLAFQDLLAAADRFALDRLKLLCAKRLWDDVSTDTVGATLACAVAHSCLELKSKCIDFFADEKNFKAAVLTDGFVQLVNKFPAILAELKVKVGA